MKSHTATITGIYAGIELMCHRLRLDSGETISLTGNVPALEPGEPVKLSGEWRSIRKCMRGREFRVTDPSSETTPDHDQEPDR